MNRIIKQKEIGKYYIALEEFINNHGELDYKVTKDEKVGDMLYQHRGGLITNNKTTANNRYYYYCRKAKEEN